MKPFPMLRYKIDQWTDSHIYEMAKETVRRKQGNDMEEKKLSIQSSIVWNSVGSIYGMSVADYCFGSRAISMDEAAVLSLLCRSVIY